MRNYLQRRENDPFNLSLFDAFDDFFAPTFSRRAKWVMATDIKENENGYQLSVDMPGFDKQDISLNLKDGYLTIEAKKEEKEDGKYLRQERHCSCSRSYYVGENITEEDVKAKYINGTLEIDLPKKDKKAIETKNIEIE